MDDFTNREVANLGASFVQLGSEAARRFCDQSQGVASAFGNWNTEVGQFMSRRMTRNLETISRIMGCGNLQEVFSIQTEWLRDASEDYVTEINRLMEVNGKVVSDTLRPAQEAATQSAEQARSSSAKVPVKV